MRFGWRSSTDWVAMSFVRRRRVRAQGGIKDSWPRAGFSRSKHGQDKARRSRGLGLHHGRTGDLAASSPERVPIEQKRGGARRRLGQDDIGPPRCSFHDTEPPPTLPRSLTSPSIFDRADAVMLQGRRRGVPDAERAGEGADLRAAKGYQIRRTSASASGGGGSYAPYPRPASLTEASRPKPSYSTNGGSLIRVARLRRPTRSWP